ncbi:MAG: hypothetical protein KF795_03355 [Labilithrix sp.]|nr:hypothetical protein [Labilithrix sp.]
MGRAAHTKGSVTLPPRILGLLVVGGLVGPALVGCRKESFVKPPPVDAERVDAELDDAGADAGRRERRADDCHSCGMG